MNEISKQEMSVIKKAAWAASHVGRNDNFERQELWWWLIHQCIAGKLSVGQLREKKPSEWLHHRKMQ